MDKEILIQYCEMKEEIKDLRRRIRELDKFLANPPVVADVVKGTRKDGTLGPIKITGIPNPEYNRKKNARERYRRLMEVKEAELLELTCQAEEYIESIEKADLRIMFRLYYIDGLPWIRVAATMNHMFPKKAIPYTEDSCRMRNNRYFEKI